MNYSLLKKCLVSFFSGKVLVLAFLSHLSNLWLDIFCSRYGFFSFVLSLISTVCELFFT